MSHLFDLARSAALCGAIAWIALTCGDAQAEPVKAHPRVVLADGDPELRRAVVDVLKPWRIDVIVAPAAPSDLAAAQVRSEEQAARFVVWRDGAQLVVYDRDRGDAERRDAQLGAFDPLGAAAAALTVKTMMRLPPPLDIEIDAPPAHPADDGDAIAVRVAAGLGGRYELGLDSNVALRFAAVASVRPWSGSGARFGLLVDLGGSATVEQAGFKGTWSHFSALALASWGFDVEAWELGPWLAIGAQHSSLDGTEMAVARSATATLLDLRGGASAFRRLGRWSVGAMLGIEKLPSTDTYTKLTSPAKVFEIPSVGLGLQLMVSADLWP